MSRSSSGSPRKRGTPMSHGRSALSLVLLGFTARAVLPLIGIAAPLVLAQAQTQAPARGGDIVMQAMRDELARSVQQLRLDTLPKPYFIAYRLTESHGVGANARLGSLLGGGEGRGSRFLQVEVRVGDYAFDNTNFFGAGFVPSAFVGFGMMPLDDDYQEVRRQLWLSTDRAYKQALEALSQKRAALETQSHSGAAIPDFSHEPVTNTVDEVPAPAANRAAIEALARELSAVFRDTPEIYNSSVSVNTSASRERYINSEGTSFVRARPGAGVNVQASTQAADGMPLGDAYSAAGLTMADLPSRDSLLTAVRNLATRLTQVRQAPLTTAYDGPVLFEGAAAGELVNTVLTPKLIAARRPVANAQLERFLATTQAGNDWGDLIGARVLPTFLSVVDDPTLHTLEGTVVDSRRVDEDGVTTHPTTLIEHGNLKTLLSSRVPVSGVEHSSGNRFSGGTLPSHLIMTADSSLPNDELRRKLLALAAAQGHDYAIVVRQLTNAATAAQQDPQAFVMAMGGMQGDAPPLRAFAAYKVYADGREELVRGVDIAAMNVASFKDIVAASRPRTLYRTVYLSRGNIFTGGGGTGAVTYLTPSLLFSSVSVRKPRDSQPRPPVVPPPAQ
jgi:hypothetical protein